jgi:hypothetical protein
MAALEKARGSVGKYCTNSNLKCVTRSGGRSIQYSGSPASAIKTTYQWPEDFEIPQYHITKR